MTSLDRAVPIAPLLQEGRAHHRTGILLVALASICWSSGGLIARHIEAGPWTVVFWRGIACASFLLVFPAPPATDPEPGFARPRPDPAPGGAMPAPA